MYALALVFVEEHDTRGSQVWQEGVSASTATDYTESSSDFEDSEDRSH